jgi:hypothetical protein
MSDREMIMDEIAQRPAMKHGIIVPRAAILYSETAEDDYNYFNESEERRKAADIIDEHADLVRKGKSNELSRNPEDNRGVCYMVKQGCDGVMDPDTCFNYCWGNFKACDRYVPDRRKNG